MKGRTYRYTTDVLFPFGFGLSYTRFEMGNASASKTVLGADESTKLTIPVRNRGKRDGTEIVQVYIRKVGDVDGPLKTLRGFQRVEVAAGKTQNAVIELDSSSFEFYDWNKRQMAVTPGDYEVLYGNSSDDKDLKVLNIKIQ
ncbi:fibronectin type III-like domain-contianing protein, partial [Desulfonatronum sp. SC1]|uniref:fibronectin type III-like domain-contianing protein n=1 Tax=Desulfonatronum sp. SC1 TaxID=2109626 RepID=UPI000D4CA4C9